MKIRNSLIALALALIPFLSMPALPAGDISPDSAPAEVKKIVNDYLRVLTSAKDLDAAAVAFVPLAGGSLVNEDGKSLRSSVKPFSLKKDFNNVKHYSVPAVIARVNVSKSSGSGFGASKIAGTVYKVYISKNDPAKGMPAPVHVMTPENAPGTAKIINIGSF